MPGRSYTSGNLYDNYKFTGHERDDEFDMTLDYMQARMYDPVIGRFLSVDPHASNYPNLSPYAYAANNPLLYIDPDGRDVVFHGSDYDEQTGITTITSIRSTNITDEDGNITGTINTRTVTQVRKTGDGESEIVGTEQTVKESQRIGDGPNVRNELVSETSESFTPGQLGQTEGLSGHALQVNAARDFVAQEGFGAVFPGDNNINNIPGTIGVLATFAGFVKDSRNITAVGATATVIEILLNRQHQRGPNRNKRFLGREIPKR